MERRMQSLVLFFSKKSTKRKFSRTGTRPHGMVAQTRCARGLPGRQPGVRDGRGDVLDPSPFGRLRVTLRAGSAVTGKGMGNLTPLLRKAPLRLRRGAADEIASMGDFKVAWFKDTEGNILALSNG